MYIKKVDVMPLDLPTRTYRTAAGTITPRPVLVRIESEDGHTGYGDVVAIVPELPGSQESITLDLVHYLAPALIGEDPFALTRVMEKLEAALPGSTFAKSALDNAIFDLIGRATGLPANAFLGGTSQSAIPVQWSLSLKDTKSMVADAKEFLSKGFRRFKIKIGPEEEMARDVENIRAIASVFDGAASIGVDANQRYTSAGIKAFLAQLGSVRLAFLEQPLPRNDIDGAADLQHTLSVPLMADESVFDLHEARRVLERRAATVLNVKVPKPGGLFNARKLAVLAEAYHAKVHVGSTLETSLGGAASLHYYAATSNVCFGVAMLGPLHHLDDVVTDECRLVPSNGTVELPSGPGLGVTVDADRVRRFASAVYEIS